MLHTLPLSIKLPFKKKYFPMLYTLPLSNKLPLKKTGVWTGSHVKQSYLDKDRKWQQATLIQDT